MTRITGSFPMTAQVDKARRRIVGTIVPFEEVGHAAVAGEPTDLTIEAGGLIWDDPNQVKLVLDHTGDRPVFAGRARDLVETDTGIVATFSVIKSAIGDQVLAEAEEGLRMGLSIEAELPPTTEAAGHLRITADSPARLHRVALVETPAFASAMVTDVAAQKAEPMPNNAQAAEVPDDQLTEVVGALQDIASTLSANLEPAAEQAPEGAAAARPGRTPAITAALTVTREAFPYGHPGAEGSSFFADQIAAKRGDTLAAARIEKAESMWLQVTAADEAATQGDITVPNVYQDALLVKLPEWPRTIADNVPTTAISSARPILVPRFDSFLADGGSGEPITAHVENTNPASAEIDVDYATYTPVLYSGKIDISREAVDAGSPGMDELLFSALRRSYNNVTDLAAYTAIVGFSGIDTGSSTTDASPAVEAQNMVSTIIQEMAAFTDRAGYPADIIWANPTQFGLLTGLNATDGRPILPYVNPQNTVGAGALANHGTVPINGVPMFNAHNVASTKVVVAATAGLHKWESPLLSFRWEEVAGPAKIRFVAAGYHLTSVLDKNAVCLITQA